MAIFMFHLPDVPAPTSCVLAIHSCGVLSLHCHRLFGHCGAMSVTVSLFYILQFLCYSCPNSSVRCLTGGTPILEQSLNVYRYYIHLHD